MHISAILFYGPDSELIISRFYRADVRKVSTEAFRMNVVAARDFSEPVLIIDNCSFMYIRENGVTIAAATRKNANSVLVFQFLYQLVEVFKAYFGEQIDKASLQSNFVLIYELLEEAMDYGFPQVLSTNVLKEYIKVGDVKMDPKELDRHNQSITSEITGAIDWRKAGKFKYRKNEVFIDVLESVNYLTSIRGTTLRSDASGKILMKTYLSGMPECKFGMNDKLMLDTSKNRSGGSRENNKTIAIDDVTFHRCVQLGKFEQERTISFIPPDGKFDLMNYRITQNIRVPFEVFAQVEEMGRNRVEYHVKVTAHYSDKVNATEVVLNIPCPTNTSRAKIEKCASGKAKYNPGSHCIVWKIKKFTGGQAFDLNGQVFRTHLIKDKAWSRPPITMDFQVPMFTASGLEVKFLKVVEKSNYQTIKWVRYITQAGNYAIRI